MKLRISTHYTIFYISYYHRHLFNPTVMTPDNELWAALQAEVASLVNEEPLLKDHLTRVILEQPSLTASLAAILSEKLATTSVASTSLNELFLAQAERYPSIGEEASGDLRAVCERDPACSGPSAPLLFFKGYHALQAYRFAHSLWRDNRHQIAMFLQNRASELFAVDIHPACRIGRRILLDHATGVVIGETAVVEDDVSILHEVTLGGTGKSSGDRHPKIAKGVLIGAGAKILGSIRIGEGAKIGAGSVVVKEVPPHCTVAGVPARSIGKCPCASPALEMDQSLDYVI